MATEMQFDKMASDMEVQMKQRCVTEFPRAEKVASIDIHQCLMNICGDPRVMQMDQKLDDILTALQAQFRDQPQAQMSGPAAPPVRQLQTASDSSPLNRKI